MTKWKTQHKIASVGTGRHGYLNQVVAPNGTTFSVNCQDVITGRVKEERMPACKCCGRDSDYIRLTLVDPTGNKPLPDPLCEFIVAACNAAPASAWDNPNLQPSHKSELTDNKG